MGLLTMHLSFVKLCRTVILLVLSTIMVACVSNSSQLNNKNQELAWQKHQQELADLTAYQATGSLSYITDKTKYYGRFFIDQVSDNQYQLKLTTPVGTSLFSLTVTPYLAEFTDRNGKKYIDENVERLMMKLTGMNVPFKSLHNWFKGLSDNPAQDKLDAQGRLASTTLSQNDQNWLLTINKYDSYRFANKTIDLPHSIDLSNTNDTLKMTINNWKIN